MSKQLLVSIATITASVIIAVLTVVALLPSVNAESIYEVSPSGNVRYDKPSYVTKGDRTYEVSPSGNVRYDKKSYKTINNKTYEVSPNGNVRYDKKSYIKK